MNKDEEIIVNLKTDEEHESVRNLSDADKKKVDKIKDKLREELGIEILKEMERQEQLEKAKAEKLAKEQEEQKTIEKPKVEHINLAELEQAKKQNVAQEKPEQPYAEEQTNKVERVSLAELEQSKAQQVKESKPTEEPVNVNSQNKQPQPQHNEQPIVNTEKPVDNSNFTKENLNERVNTSKEKSKNVVRERTYNEPQKNSAEAIKQAQERYSQFMEQYSRKEDIVDVSSLGRYDSELDFQLNRKIKKVRFPMPKYAKILLCCLAVIILAATGVGLAIFLYEEPPEILLTKITMSQPQSGSYYVVNNVYVGDKLNYDNIYLNCEYSDGSSKEVSLSRDMIKAATTKIDSNDIFIESGEAVFQVKYLGQTLNLKYVVEKKTIQNISLFVPNATSTYNIIATSNTLDITNSVVVNAKYSNGKTQRININDCSYKISGMTEPAKIQNGIISLGTLNNGQSYEVVIYYGQFNASFKIFVNMEQSVTE